MCRLDFEDKQSKIKVSRKLNMVNNLSIPAKAHWSKVRRRRLFSFFVIVVIFFVFFNPKRESMNFKNYKKASNWKDH